MVFDLIGLVFLGLAAAALLSFVPRPASRTWAAGLLVFAVIWNLATVLVTVAAYFSPPSVYLDTEKNQLQFNRGEKGELFGVMVNNPPEECRATDKNRPWSLATGNLVIAAVALVFLRRTTPTSASPSPKEQTPGSKT
jgi:hypothetical protein